MVPNVVKRQALYDAMVVMMVREGEEAEATPDTKARQALRDARVVRLVREKEEAEADSY